MKFKKETKVPQENPYDGESWDSQAVFGCDCELTKTYNGFTMRPCHELGYRDAMITAEDHKHLPHWLNDITLYARPAYAILKDPDSQVQDDAGDIKS